MMEWIDWDKNKYETRAAVPAGDSLAAAGVDALWQGVVQTGINDVQAYGLLMDLTAGVSEEHSVTKSGEKGGFIFIVQNHFKFD